MSDKDAMAFHLTVTTGPEEGKTFRVEPGECVIGRAPTSTIVLTDDSVAWEHVMLRTEGSNLLVQNLAAAGTRLKGRPIAGEVKLATNEEIELSERCKVVVQHQVGRGSRKSVKPGLILAVITLVIVVAGSAYFLTRPQENPPPPWRQAHWDRAYQRLEERLVEWTGQGAGAGYEEMLTVFRRAQRMERAFNPEAAMTEWDHLLSLLLTIKRPGGMRTIAQTKDEDAKKALGVVSEWDPVTSTSTEPYYDGDEAYADALARYVRRRSQITHKMVEEGQ